MRSCAGESSRGNGKESGLISRPLLLNTEKDGQSPEPLPICLTPSSNGTPAVVQRL